MRQARELFVENADMIINTGVSPALVLCAASTTDNEAWEHVTTACPGSIVYIRERGASN